MLNKLFRKFKDLEASFKRVIFLLILLGFFLGGFYYYEILKTSREKASLIVEESISDIVLPVRLKIPSLGVDAPFEYVGLTPEGAMDVPKGPAEVAWYKLGSKPGDIGSAVVAGHSGYKNNKMGVFDNLYKLKKGDKLYIEDEKGNTIIFVVRESRKFNPKADALDVFGSSDGKAHMNLVTCVGAWNDVERTHSERLVVFTDKVES